MSPNQAKPGLISVMLHIYIYSLLKFSYIVEIDIYIDIIYIEFI